MIFNQIKYKWQNNNVEITAIILSPVAGDSPLCYTLFFMSHDFICVSWLLAIEVCSDLNDSKLIFN